MKGSYILIIQVKKDMKVKIGKLGILSFKRGYYAYVGSAMNGLEGRIRHHLRHNKKMHWHIDYFLSKAEIKEIWYSEEDKECEIAGELSFPFIQNFGCSDCKCKSHLFYAPYKNLLKAIKKMGMRKYEI
ncbi:endonuclease [Thermoplasmatales archaeon ex4484_30]|nr:MAG: endonuclease [Thermoplasmatales archaeon ex4484_30]